MAGGGRARIRKWAPYWGRHSVLAAGLAIGAVLLLNWLVPSLPERSGSFAAWVGNGVADLASWLGRYWGLILLIYVLLVLAWWAVQAVVGLAGVRGRDASLWAARRSGRAFRWLVSDWRLPLLGLGITTLGLWTGDRILGRPELFHWWKVLLVYCGLVLVWWGWRVRTRVVFEPFVDQSEDPPKPAQGISTLLRVELDELRDLYAEVNELVPSPRTEGGGPRDVQVMSGSQGIKVDDVSPFLATSVSSESSVTVGPISLPMGPTLSLLGRLVQGPRVTGSLQKAGRDRTLTVHATQRGISMSWRVDGVVAEDSSDERATLGRMVKQLACEMFNDLALRGTTEWESLMAFNEGLRLYRASQRVETNQEHQLQQAESKFMEALCKDRSFKWGYYNLGEVYRLMDRPDAAELAFRKAIEQNPEEWRPYYALALSRWAANDFDSAIDLCNRVIDLNPRAPHAYLGKSVARLGRQARRASVDALLRSARKAVTISWRALCREEFKGGATAETKLITQQSLLALARTNRYVAERAASAFFRSRSDRRVDALARQALWLDRRREVCVDVGRLYEDRNKPGLAADAFEKAVTIDPGYLHSWALFAHALAQSQKSTDHRFTVEDIQNAGALLLRLTANDPFAARVLLLIRLRTRNQLLQARAEEVTTPPDRLQRRLIRDFNRLLKRDLYRDGIFEGLDLHPATVEAASSDPPESDRRRLNWLLLQQALDPSIQTVNREAALRACERIRGAPSEAYRTSRESLHLVEGAYFLLNKPERASEVRDMARLLDFGDSLRAPVPQQLRPLVDLCLALGRVWESANAAFSLAEIETVQGNEQAADRLNAWGIQHLQEALSNRRDNGTDRGRAWECAQMAISLGWKLRRLGQPDTAASYYELAIEYLKDEFDREIATTGLRVELAYTYEMMNRRAEAMEQLRGAVGLDPLSAFERKRLAEKYYELNEYDKALDSWERALMLEPNDPETHFRIALTHRKLVDSLGDDPARGRHALAAHEHLSQTISLAGTENSGLAEWSGRAHFVLAVVNFEDGEYQKAIPHLLITETVEVEPLLSKLLSGWAYRRVSMYDMAEDELRLAIEKAAEALSDRVMAAPPSADVRSAFNAVIGARTWILGLSLAEVLVRAWMELACSYAERDADLPEEVLNVLPLAPVVIRQMDDELARRETEALYHGNLGWILFKQGRENEAVAHLRRSISLEPDAEMYLRLALVLETKLSSYPPSERKRRVVQIERYLDHVPELDRIGEYGEDVRALRQRLQAMVPTPPNGQVARAQLSRATR